MGAVFNLFTSDRYQFAKVDRGAVEGNKITETIEHEGIFKLRNGMVQGERELAKSGATLHVYPEDYGNPDGLVGNGIICNGEIYRIAGVTVGKDFDTGEIEFYRLTLESEQLVGGGF